MISSLLKRVIEDCGLTQKKLADVLGVGVDRVKSLTSGKVQKLTREEGEALIRKLHIRGDWLATGEGPMFQSEGERRYVQRLDALHTAITTTAEFELSELEQELIRELLYYTETGDNAGLRRVLNRLSQLSEAEATLLGNFRHSSQEAQDALIKTSAALSQPLSGKIDKKK